MRRRAALAVLSVAVSGAVLIPAAPANACMGEVCDVVNFVCMTAFKGRPCVG